VALIALVLIWVTYVPLVSNYPMERQLRDAQFILTSYGFRPAVNLDLALIQHPLTRPLGQYLLGVLMVQQRSAGGNTAYFLGEVSAAGSRGYFPLLYLIKEPLALHVLTLVALLVALKEMRSSRRELSGESAWRAVRRWVENHFIEFTALSFVAFYWAVSIKSPLNIGVRHILPTFPFVYVLVAKKLTAWLRQHESVNPLGWLEWLKNLYQLYVKAIPKYLLVAVLLLWMTAETLMAFPDFLSYYNELGGGSENGYRVAVDSNYDWGQDLKRLRDFVLQNRIEKIALDYFGGGNPRYYLGESFEPWWSSRGPAQGWFAISATLRQGAFGIPVPGFTRKPEDSYEWLKHYEPPARAGYSIFIYRLPSGQAD
jgi:hypothetical protein